MNPAILLFDKMCIGTCTYFVISRNSRTNQLNLNFKFITGLFGSASHLTSLAGTRSVSHPGPKKDSRTPQQFREMNTLMPDINVGFGVASDPPIHAFKPVSKARFMSGTPVILSSIH